MTSHRLFALVQAGAAAMLALSVFALAPAYAHAASLTDAQIQSIENLMSSFGATPDSVSTVDGILRDQSTGSTQVAPAPSVQSPAPISSTPSATAAASAAASTGGPLDILSYFVSQHPDKVLQGGGAYWNQTVDLAHNRMYLDKTTDDTGATPRSWIGFTWDDTYIYNVENNLGDSAQLTSHQGTVFSPGVWMKRYMSVGDAVDSMTWDQTAMTTVDLSTCSTISSAPGGYRHRDVLEAHYPAYNLGGDLGVQDVIVLRIEQGTYSEKEYYAKGWGFVGWDQCSVDGTLCHRGTNVPSNEPAEPIGFAPFSAFSTARPALTADNTYACAPALRPLIVNSSKSSVSMPTGGSGGSAAAQETLSAICTPAGTGAHLSWLAVPGATQYLVRANDTTHDASGCSAPTVAGPGGSCVSPTDYVVATGATAVDISVPAGKLITWWIHSIVNGTQSPATVSSFTCAAPPDAPTNLKAICNADGTQVTLSWSPAANATSYQLVANDPATSCPDQSIWDVKGANCNAGSGADYTYTTTATQKTFSITPGKSVTWWVYGQNAAGQGAYALAAPVVCTPSVTGTPSQPTATVSPLPPASLNANCTTDNKTMAFGWPASAGATTYELHVNNTTMGGGTHVYSTAQTAYNIAVNPGDVIYAWIYANNSASPASPRGDSAYVATRPTPVTCGNSAAAAAPDVAGGIGQFFNDYSDAFNANMAAVAAAPYDLMVGVLSDLFYSMGVR